MGSIDIVIPAAGRTADLLRLLASLHAHCGASMTQHVASVTVTDDRATPATRQTLRDHFPAVHYVPGPARGPAANRNHGAAEGRAEWILFLDDDCYTEVDLVRAYVEAVQSSPQAQGIEGAIRPVGARPNGNHHAPLNLQGGCLWSCNMMLARRSFQSLGGFDERFPFACMEDVDLRERLRAAGAKTVFAPGAAVLHPWRSVAERELTRQIISHAIYATKHRDFARHWTLLHAARMCRARLRLYASGGFSSIPVRRYGIVAYDLAGPLLLLAATRVGWLRHALNRRHVNGPAQAQRA